MAQLGYNPLPKSFAWTPLMWFKQLTLYRLDPQALPALDALEAALQQRPFAPCAGWTGSPRVLCRLRAISLT